MGFVKTTGTTEYDMTVFLTPLGVDKFYGSGLLQGVKYFSVGDHDSNYLCYSGLTYTYDIITGGIYSDNAGVVDVKLGNILNLRGTIDRGSVIDSKTLPVNVKKMYSPVWQYPDTGTTSEEFLVAYKLSNGDKIFDKPIVLGGRNVWHNTLSGATNLAEGFLYYLPPATPTQDYTGTTEPTLGIVPTTLTGHTSFPGVSVTDGNRSWTEIQYFYVLNKTDNHMFFDQIILRENILPVSHNLYRIDVNEDYSSEFTHIKYILQWQAKGDGQYYVDGALNVFVPKEIYNKTKTVLLPYEIIRFGVSFEIIDPGSTIAHWRGQSYVNPLVYEGEYNFTLEITSAPELNAPAIYSTIMNIVVKVKDSGYNPNTYITPAPISGGGTVQIVGVSSA